MRLLKIKTKKLKAIQVAFYIISAIVLFYSASWLAALLIQYPPARQDIWVLFVFAFSIAGFILSVIGAKEQTNTKFSKETYYSTLLFIGISLSFLIFANILLRLEISSEHIITISVLVSTPLSCVMAGYAKRTIKNRLKRLGLNRGTTLVTIFILASIPIIEFNPFSGFISLPSRGTILPNLMFQSTENTPGVNGQINNSGFFAEIPIRENRTFELEKIVELAVANLGNQSSDFTFYMTGFKGNSEFLNQFELYVMSSSERVCVVNMDNGVICCNQTMISLEPNNKLSLDIRCTGAETFTFQATLSLHLSISCHGRLLQKTNILLRTV